LGQNALLELFGSILVANFTNSHREIEVRIAAERTRVLEGAKGFTKIFNSWTSMQSSSSFKNGLGCTAEQGKNGFFKNINNKSENRDALGT